LDKFVQGILGFASRPKEGTNALPPALDAIDDLRAVIDDELPSLAGTFAVLKLSPIALA
jgi:hypothetical protein